MRSKESSFHIGDGFNFLDVNVNFERRRQRMVWTIFQHPPIVSCVEVNVNSRILTSMSTFLTPTTPM